jgi:hypothetical protein
VAQPVTATILARPTVYYDTSATPVLTRDQAIALLDAADGDAGPQADRTAALVAPERASEAHSHNETGAA